jgi:hypothetical protein
MKLSLLLSLLLAIGCTQSKSGGNDNFSKSITFHASFDGRLDADFANGDPKLYSAADLSKRAITHPGLPSSGIVVASGQGRFGDALRFTKKQSPMIFFKGPGNVHYSADTWSGTVSFWLRLDPETELEPGYTDPIQITPKAWNDAAFFVEFGKDEKPRHFRLGAYADLKVWNPYNRDWNTIPMSEKPLVSVERPPFSRDRWTHVVFTWQNFNTHRPDGIATLYLNGQKQGALSPRLQTWTWDLDQTRIMLGLSYIGLFDELTIFNRALSEDEVQQLHNLKTGVKSAGSVSYQTRLTPYVSKFASEPTIASISS